LNCTTRRLSHRTTLIHCIHAGIGTADTVYEAIRLMAEKNVGSLLVMSDGKLVGLVAERHYARNIALKSKASPQTPVRAIM